MTADGYNPRPRDTARLTFRFPWLILGSLGGLALLIGGYWIYKETSPPPRLLKISSATACDTALNYAVRRFSEDSFREIVIGNCAELSLQEQKDGSWLATGSATAKQYGTPVALQWIARTVAFAPNAIARVCDFGFAGVGTMGTATPTVLQVPGCR